MPNNRNLMVVAHPDDEVLFGYSALVTASWDVVCCTNGDHAQRSVEFGAVSRKLGYRAYMFGYPDEWGGGFPVDQVREDLLGLGIHYYERVLTHNAQGEYGHSQHSALHYIVKSLAPKNMYVFGQGIRSLPFRLVQDKMSTLQMYTSQYELDAFDWHDSEVPSNNLMKYVIHEEHTRIH